MFGLLSATCRDNVIASQANGSQEDGTRDCHRRQRQPPKQAPQRSPLEVAVRRRAFVWLAIRWHRHVVLGAERWAECFDGVCRWLEDQAGLTESEWTEEVYRDAAA